MTTVYLFVERPIQVIGLFILITFTTLNKCKVISMHAPAITGRGTKRTRYFADDASDFDAFSN